MRRADWLLLGLLFFLPTVALWRHTLGGACFFMEDAGDFHYCYLDFLRRSLHEGLLPLWNPYIVCGQSYAGHPSTPLFYPFNYLVYGMAPDRYIVWTVALHMGAGGVGMWFWARLQGFSRPAASFAACIYGLCTPMCSDVERFQIPQILGLLPWFFAFCELSLRKSYWMGPAALVLTGQILAGSPQHVHLEALLLVTFYLVGWGPAYGWGKAALRVGGLSVLGLGGAAAWIFSQAEEFQVNLRSQALAEYFRVYGATLDTVLGALWAKTGYAFPCSLFLLAMLGLLFGRSLGQHRRLLAVSGVLIVLGLVLALGNDSPIEGLLGAVVPLYGKFRYRHRYLFLTIFGLIWAAVVGMEWLWQRTRASGKRWTEFLPPALGLCAVGQSFLLCAHMNLPFDRVFALKSEAAPLLSADSGFYRVLAMPNIRRKYWDWGMVDGYRNIVGFITNGRTEYQEFLFYVTHGRPMTRGDAQLILNMNLILLDLPPLAPGLRVLGLKYVMSSAGPDKPMRLTPVQGGVPHAFLCPRWTVMPDRNALFSTLCSAQFQPEQTALFLAPAPPDLGEPSPVGALLPPLPPCMVDDHNPNRLEISVFNPADHPLPLVVSDVYDEGWMASLNGQPTPLLRVDGVLRGVLVPPGSHRVEMRFWPASLRYGLPVSAFFLLASLGFTVWSFRRRDKG